MYYPKFRQTCLPSGSRLHSTHAPEYLPVGSVAPYDYASAQIVEMLTNRRKVEFLKKFEEELYNDAVRSGDVEFYTEP